MKRLGLAVVLFLSGCVTSNEYAAPPCNNFPTFVQRANCLNHYAYDQPYQGSDEIVAYRKVLIERVHSGKMTDNEAEYAMAQKAREMTESIPRANTVYVPQQTQPTYPQRKTKTVCNETLGGFECESKPSGPDLSVFHRLRSF